MFRVTLNEAASILGYKRTWLYNTLPKLGCKDRKFVGIKTIYDLIKYSFMAESYEKYPYDRLVDKRVTKAVMSGISVRELGEAVAEPADLYEILIALKIAKPEASMFNIVSYVCRKVGREKWREGFKEYVFSKLWRMFQANKVELDIFISRKVPTYKIDGNIQDEILKELRQIIWAK